MKIICGTDFSRHADEAAHVAAVLATRLKGTVALAHVFETTRYELLSKDMYNYLRGRRQAKLRTEAQRLRKTGARVEERLLEGSPASALTEFAAETQARLIVVSSLGQIAPSRWFVGSVAERVAQMAPVPTLVVRGEEAFRAWTRGERPLNILVGFDFSGGSEAALRWAASLQEIGPCKMTVVSLAWPPQQQWRLGIGDDRSFPDNPPAVQQVLERDLRRRCEELAGKARVQIRVAAAWGRPDPQLIELARVERADVMVVGTNQRHGLERFWLGSVSRGILHHAPMSVACVPASAADDSAPGHIPVFKRVMVATDFSKLGNRAIPFAYSTLYRGGIVCLIHVTEPAVSGAKVQEAQRKWLKKLEEELRALIPSEGEARWITTEVEVVASRQPSRAICQSAERFGADLICLGSHGRSGLSRAILGSVAQDVMAHSRRPVLVVRPLIP
jgi:nucleotide-binding universal stress UspA family protein